MLRSSLWGARRFPMEAMMVGTRSLEAADGKLVGYGEKADFSLLPPSRFGMFGEEKLAGWDPALDHDDDGAEHIQLRFHDDLEWSGADGESEHIVWRFQ